MALTLPSEISTEKDKQGNSPLLLIEFTALAVYVGSKSYTMDYGGAGNKVFADDLKRPTSLSFTKSIPQLVNRISSDHSLTIQITDYQGTYRSSVLGSAPDLTNSAAIVYLKYDTSTNTKTNAIEIFNGYISDYYVERDIMTIRLTNPIPFLAEIPANLIPNSGTICKPLQYGNLSWLREPAWWGEYTPHYAVCPLINWDDVNYTVRYWIADHEMNNVTTTTSWADPKDTPFHVVRDYMYMAVIFGGYTITNTASGAYIDASAIGHVYLLKPPTTAATGNTVSAWANTVDGKQSTSATVNSGSNKLSVGSPYGYDEVKEENLNAVPTISAWVNFGTITNNTTDGNITVTDGTNTTTVAINNTNSNTWVERSFPSACNALSEIEDYRVEVNLGGLTSAVVKNVIIHARMQDLSADDPYLYFSCQGREFGSTWNSRKTAAFAIDTIPEVIESLLRHEWGYGDADIDGDSFDAVHDYFISTNIDAAGTLWQKQDGRSVLTDILASHNLALTYTTDQKWRLFYPRAGGNDFTNSGTGTPGNEDIFNDTDSISSNTFSQHIIFKKGLKLRRTSASERYGKITVNTAYTHQGYLHSDSTGSGKELILNSRFLTSGNAASWLLDIDDWLIQQKWLAEIKTSWNAIGLQLGDVINIRHSDLTDAILDATENTQKWMIVDIKTQWRPHQIIITAIELY